MQLTTFALSVAWLDAALAVTFLDLPPVAPRAVPRQATAGLVQRSSRRVALHPKGTAHFGDTLCPCIGFDNIAGEISVDYGKFKVTYPADLGARCEKWENNRHPDCKPGGNPGPGKGKCAQAWCLVDSCNCNLPLTPLRAEHLPDARYRGRPLFYSFETCGGVDTWSKEIPEIGASTCRCVGFDNLDGTTEINWKIAGSNVPGEAVDYPADLGGSCKAWDKDTHPSCHGSGKKPDWCEKKWCYVDPCSCNVGVPPKVTMYLPQVTYTGKSLYYSYETCGAEDTFTTQLNLEACVNQKSKDKCLGLHVRNGVQKCEWTGTNCLGSELVNHPLCSHLNVGGDNIFKNSAFAALPGALLVLLAIAAA